MNKIILTYPFEEQIEILSRGIDKAALRVFSQEEFGVEDARNAIQEAYISSDHGKRIVIAASKYTKEAQNALLKVLEESPSGVEFILLGLNKNTFLPTILSRAILEDKRERLKIEPFELDLKTMKLEDIYSYLKKHSYSQEEVKQQIQSLLLSIHQAKVELNEKELEFFNEAVRAQASYQRFEYTLLPLLLMLLKRKRK